MRRLDRVWRWARHAVFVPLLVSACGETERCPAPDRGPTMLRREFVLIEPGTFVMGSTNDDHWERPQMFGEITRPFWIQTTEVTVEENLRVTDAYMESTGVPAIPVWARHQAGPALGTAETKATEVPNTPLTQGFGFAVFYANMRSVLEGYTPCYPLSVCRLWEVDWEDTPLGFEFEAALGCAVVAAAHIVPGCDGYRLPTEAEWEYAGRTGSTTDYYCGDDYACMDDYSAIRVNPRMDGRPWQPWWGAYATAQLCPNAWGLYDMHGNMSEWVNDRWVQSWDADGIPVWNYATGPWNVDPVRSAAPIEFTLRYPFRRFSVPGFPEEWEGGLMVAKGAGVALSWEGTNNASTALNGDHDLAGFRVVRTAFEVMAEREAAGE